MLDPDATTYGLPPCLRIPIAAYSVDAISKYVGSVIQMRRGRDGRVNACRVDPYDRAIRKDPRVGLWKEPLGDFFEAQLHPPCQLWVHVDYHRYRWAHEHMDMPAIPVDHVLDHVLNREAIRLQGYSHPYLRLCPVSREVNTSGGSKYGLEGMHKESVKNRHKMSAHRRDRINQAICQSDILYADPMDITKMLNLPPGPRVLPGVAKILKHLYTEWP